MSNNQKITTNQLRPGSVVMISGILKFSRLAKQISGEALQRDIIQQQKMGSRYPITRPHTKLTIDNAQIVPENPNNKSIEEAYFEQNFYQSQAQGYSGRSFSAVNKGNMLPAIYHRQPDGSVKQILLADELDNNQPVTIMMRVYATKGNNGVTLDSVIIESETIRYYSNDASAENLAKRGITFIPLSPEENQKRFVGGGDPEESLEPEYPPVSPPTSNQNAYSNKPVQPQQQTYQQQMPIYNHYTQQQQPQPPQQNQNLPFGQQNQAPNQNSYNGSENQTGGIRYDASDRQY